MLFYLYPFLLCLYVSWCITGQLCHSVQAESKLLRCLAEEASFVSLGLQEGLLPSVSPADWAVTDRLD